MGNNLFTVLITTLKAKITPIVSRIRMWTSWNFIRTHLISKIRDFFASLLDVKPRHKKDYYPILGWLVSKRLAFAVVVAVGVLSVFYLFSVGNVLKSARTEGIKTYSYRSLMLRFVSEKVRITGKSGYLAYEGDVEKGYATGSGTLYNKNGVVVYQGAFVKNKYQGNGTSYYDDGTMEYTGSFSENQFDGSGKLYRENGSIAYEGGFALGRKDGQGTLYDSGGSAVYSGSFSQDELVYSELLGKTAQEVAQAYTGARTLYGEGDAFVVLLEDIDAMYLGGSGSESLSGERTVDQIFVLKNTFPAGEKKCETISDLREYFGAEAYEGNSEATLPEALAMNRLAEAGNAVRAVDMELNSEYSDYYTVESWDHERPVYLYSFEKDGLDYTFICEDKESTFSFYSIEKQEGGTDG